jgi:hypothetical protein
MLVASLLAAALPSFAEGVAAPGLDKRQENQLERIAQGVRSGSLTAAEARGLVRSERQLQRHERRAQLDGVVTAREQSRLRQESVRSSRHIYRQKHDRQDRP